MLPEDEPGTDYNPNFKTPVDAKPLGHMPAIRPVFIQSAAVDTQPRTLKPSETTTELVALDNDSETSSEDLPTINRTLHGSHGSERQYNSSGGDKSAGSAPVSVGSAPVSAGSAPPTTPQLSGSNGSEKMLKPSETTIEMVQQHDSDSDDFQSEMMRVESVQAMSDSASYAALQGDSQLKSGAVGGVL